VDLATAHYNEKAMNFTSSPESTQSKLDMIGALVENPERRIGFLTRQKGKDSQLWKKQWILRRDGILLARTERKGCASYPRALQQWQPEKVKTSAAIAVEEVDGL
jgi:hypothetical protein